MGEVTASYWEKLKLNIVSTTPQTMSREVWAGFHPIKHIFLKEMNVFMVVKGFMRVLMFIPSYTVDRVNNTVNYM